MPRKPCSVLSGGKDMSKHSSALDARQDFQAVSTAASRKRLSPFPIRFSKLNAPIWSIKLVTCHSAPTDSRNCSRTLIREKYGQIGGCTPQRSINEDCPLFLPGTAACVSATTSKYSRKPVTSEALLNPKHLYQLSCAVR